MSVPLKENGVVTGSSRLMGIETVRASPVKLSAVEQAVLLFVGDNHVVYVVSLRVLALEGRSARFPVFGDRRSHGHRHLAALLGGGLDRVGVDSLHRECVRVWDAGDRVVLAVEFCVVLNVKRASVCVRALTLDRNA